MRLEIVKTRNIFIDNVKGVLIFLVVFGHTIYPYIYENFGLFMVFVYIYSFHMPLFVYISGVLSKNIEKTQQKAFQRFLLPYLVWNSFAFILSSLYHGKLEFSFLHPFLQNWYFLSLFTMCMFLPIMIKIRWCICGIFLVSLIVGLLPEFNGTFSFSKTVCFYGYFLLGYYSNKETLDKIRRNKNIIIILGIIIMIIIYAYCAIMGIDRTVLTAVLGVLSKSDSYKDAGMNIANGIIMRMASIPVSIILGMIVMIFTPVKKNIFTRIGRNSIIIFIFHEYFVVLSWGIMRLLNVNIAIEIVLSLIFSIGITLFLSIDAFQRLYEKIMRTIETIILKE